jgi:CO dehydrogenase maturation factor
MIIGFLGKGGSGKSTLATLMVKYLLEKDKQVLAIDADHNMDLSYNLGVTDTVNYSGTSMTHIKAYVGADPDYRRRYREIFLTGPKNRFNIFPNDPYTKEYAVQLSDKLQVMVAGPHTEEIWEGDKCSHSLFTSLKIYLPYLDLKESQYVVIDEKAGMDPVGTIVPAGFDVAVISVEPTRHSTKTANQISRGLEVYGTPYIFVGNKITKQEDIGFIKNNLWQEPAGYIWFDSAKTHPFESPFTDAEKESLEKILEEARSLANTSKKREVRATNFWSKSK